MRMSKTITIHEGECEKSIIQWLKTEGYVFGRLIKRTFEDISRIDRILNFVDETTNVVIVMDTDTICSSQEKKNRFVENIEYLLDTARNVSIITQDKNLEDELIRGLGLSNERDLFKHFSVSSKSEYKSKLAQMDQMRVAKKMENLNTTVFWSRKVVANFAETKYEDFNVTILEMVRR